MVRIKDIAEAIENFAPLSLQESYDNAGLQIGHPDNVVNSVLLCLDVTEEIMDEAGKKGCDLIISHHPLLFSGLKHITGATTVERIVEKALKNGIAIYSAHTNLDSAFEGINYEIASQLGLDNIQPLAPNKDFPGAGLGAFGNISPTPCLEFLRKVKDMFNVRHLRYSRQSKGLVVRKIALCGGAGASLIPQAIALGADLYLTGDLKYHDFTSYGPDIILADIGHYESELCSLKIFARILAERFPQLPFFYSEADKNPIKTL